MVYRLILSYLKKSYIHNLQTHIVLDDINFTFNTAATYGISGSSGSGKSTLLHILAGLDTPTSGSITFQGSKDSFLKRCGIIFQMPYLINELTVVENVILKSLIEHQSYAKAREDGILLLEKVGLAGKHDAYPPQLSGGQQQRVAIARALCNKPDFILADEPTSNLDETTGKIILKLLLACQEEWQFGLIVCSHDQYVLECMQMVLKLENGKLYDYKKNITLQSSSSQWFNTAQ